MTKKSQLFAFVVGEVSPQFYGRRDLAKFPLAVKTEENFFVDYRGGAVFSPGTEFIAGVPNVPHRLVRFRSRERDITLFFTASEMQVLRSGSFVLTGNEQTVTLSSGAVAGNFPFSNNDFVLVELAAGRVYGRVRNHTDAGFEIEAAYEVPLSGPAVVTEVYTLPISLGAAVRSARFFQDRKTLIITDETFQPKILTWADDDDWAIAELSAGVPTPPTGLTGVASGVGAASVAFTVTAVVGDVESGPATQLVLSSIANYSAETGNVTLSWTPVTNATRYNVYRSVVYPGAFPDGAQLAYLGYTVGTTFVDMNATADFTKAPPNYVDFFAGNNFPALYCRFQQRGAFAGLANNPLTVVSSIARQNNLFAISAPPVATDSYEYELDASSDRPIKHMLPLRYGLMLFTEDGVWQLKGGGESYALTATNAVAEDQGNVSVGDAQPIAINLDLLFLSSLNTELNAMLYTEYTNSFKMQDILVLAAHLFGPDNKVVRMEWAPEPHKLVHFIREDGQRVTLTYERNQEVYGWARRRTRGRFVDLCVVTEDKFNVCYNTVLRSIGGEQVLCLERDKPVETADYSKMWYVDSGIATKLQIGAVPIRLRRTVPGDNYALWELRSSNLSWATVGVRFFAKNGMFEVVSLADGYANCLPMSPPQVSTLYDRDELAVNAGEWRYGVPERTLGGLWHLEGETVSILADGDGIIDLTVENGEVTLVDPAASIVVGLPYHGRLETLPLGLEGYSLDGTSMTIRGVAFRQQLTRGLSLGRSFDAMDELPSRTVEPWGVPLSMLSELTLTDLFGWGGWEADVSICFEQRYPFPTNILGVTADLDVGE